MLSSRLARVFFVLMAVMVFAGPTFAASRPPTGPKITNCSPNSGPTMGGTTVLVNGSGFVSGAIVAFGSVNAKSTTFVSSSQLRAVTAPAAAGAVTVKVTQGGTSGSLASAFTFVAPPPAVRCTWANSTDGAHPVISGLETTVRGTVKSTSTSLTYAWTFTDGKPGASGTVTDPNAIEAAHTFTGTAGKTTFTATLTVKDGTTLVGTDTYKVAVVKDSQANRKLIAIERGLWYSHVNTRRDNAANGAPRGWINNSNDRYANWDVPLNTMVTGTGFVENGFNAVGSADNPYTEDVQRYVNYVTEKLAIMDIGPKGDGSPAFPYLYPEERNGTMKDGKAVYFEPESETEYEYGIALRFLANCGYSTQKPAAWNDALNKSSDPAATIKNWTISEIVQQMVDFFSWAQVYDKGNDYGQWTCDYNATTGMYECHQATPSKSDLAVRDDRRGSWPYWSEGYNRNWVSTPNPDDPSAGYWENSRGTYGETVLAYWVVTGMKFGQLKMNVNWPAFVKTELDYYLQRNQERDPASPFYGEFHFGEGYGHHMVERAGQALVLLNWVGRPTLTDPQVLAAKGYIEKFWGRHNYEHRQDWRWSQRGDQQCTNEVDGVTPEDCYSHFSLTQFNEFGHNSPIWDCNHACINTQCVENRYCITYQFDEFGNYVYDEFGNYACAEAYYNPCEWSYCLEESTECDGTGRHVESYEWVLDGRTNQMNIFGMLGITEGLKAVGAASTFPAAEPLGWQGRYLKLLLDNQLSSGMWNDRGWVWDSGYGTGWSLMMLSNL